MYLIHIKVNLLTFQICISHRDRVLFYVGLQAMFRMQADRWLPVYRSKISNHKGSSLSVYHQVLGVQAMTNFINTYLNLDWVMDDWFNPLVVWELITHPYPNINHRWSYDMDENLHRAVLVSMGKLTYVIIPTLV